MAAALAVLAAVVSGWTSQRVLELQEDAAAPNPVPLVDVRSRYSLAQFKITNYGGSSAHNVSISWERQLKDSAGADVTLGRDAAIAVIPERESASVLLGLTNQFIGANGDTTCRGTMRFENASGREFSKTFTVSAEHERVSLVHSDELPKTLYELQQIPDGLRRVAKELDGLTQAVRSQKTTWPSNIGSQPTAADDL